MMSVIGHGNPAYQPEKYTATEVQPSAQYMQRGAANAMRVGTIAWSMRWVR